MFDSQKVFWGKASFAAKRDAFIPFADRITPTYLSGQRVLPSVRSAMIREQMTILKRAYDHAAIRSLTDPIWRQLDDSRSWWTLTPAEVNQELIEERVLDPVSVVSEMVDTFNAGKVEAPIIVVNRFEHDKQYRLVSGNLQLMICRSSRIIPKCVFVDLD
jgi:hypothetical protein